MKTGLVLLLTAWAVVFAAEARTWTNAEGKTLEAEIVKVEAGQVYLRLDRNGQVRPLKLEWLSEEDQEYAKKFASEQAERNAAEERANREAEWHTGYDEVKAEAEKFNMPILLLYTAPEWCGYCVRLENNILDKDEFKAYANANLVLFLADFSNSSNKENWMEEYPDLIRDFPVDGYPCAYLISKSGRNLGKIGGYDANWSVNDYIGKLENYKKNDN